MSPIYCCGALHLKQALVKQGDDIVKYGGVFGKVVSVFCIGLTCL